MKVPVIENDNFTTYLEVHEGLLFIHCDVHKWSKTVRKKMKSALKGLIKKYKQPLYAAQIDNDNKHRKFLDMYGFKYFGIVKDFEGNSREVFVKGVKKNG
jgi:hypothetical protein